MLSLQTIALLVSISSLGQAPAVGETVLLSFSAGWCGPCQKMKPAVDRLAAAGYPVRQVDVDRDRATASQHRVTSLPSFVMIVGGREVDRAEGMTDAARLEAMLAKANVGRPGDGSPRALAQSPDDRANPALVLPGQPSAAPLATAPLGRHGNASGGAPAPGRPAQSPLVERLLSATVRLRVDDKSGHSYGTGTIIDTRGEEALVLTCGHIFRDSSGQGKVWIDLPAAAGSKPVQGKVLSYDLKRDLGLVSFRPATPVSVARVADKQHQVSLGQRVINVGCNNGQHPTALNSRVTALDKYLGPPNLEVAGIPVEGRSGGGLFDEEGKLIGVCFAADPSDNEGVYAALGSIHAELDRMGLRDVYHSQGSEPTREPRMVAAEPPSMPSRMPAAPPHADGAATRLTSAHVEEGKAPSTRLSDQERAALSEIGTRSEEAEVICIIRPLSNPDAKSEIIVLDRASPVFLEQLSRAARAQDKRRLTSLEIRPKQAPIELQPSRDQHPPVQPTVQPQEAQPTYSSLRPTGTLFR